jgi:ferritin-like metal-binding protein YciE
MHMATTEERLTEWLRDAHATEEQAKTMLEGTSGRIENYPAFKERLAQQAEIAARHADVLQECLEKRSESPSAIKEMTGKITAIGQTLSGYVVGDEVIKAALATITFAQMQAASYRILVATAQAAGDPETASLCEDLLQDETSFADWLDQHLPHLTSEYLSREEAGQTAKH